MNDDNSDEPPSAFPKGPPAPQTGYKNPPEAHRFEKGKSGNPRGRPKGAKDKGQIIEKVLFELHEVVEGKRRVNYTTLELILIALRNRSFEGSTRAFKDFEVLAATFNPQPAAKRFGCLVVPGRLSKDLWKALYEDDCDPTQEE
jgi:Family of unknown function (DUF5681)